MRVLYWLARGKPSAAVTSALEILDEQDNVVFRTDKPVAVDAASKADVDVPLAGLKLGGYRLRVKAGEGPGMAVRDVGFAIAAVR